MKSGNLESRKSVGVLANEDALYVLTVHEKAGSGFQLGSQTHSAVTCQLEAL